VRIPRALLPHTIKVEAYLGSGPYGDAWDEPVTIRHAQVDDKRRVVRAPDGSEVVSETTVRLELHHQIPPGSRVTVWPGTPLERTATVISASLLTFPGAPSHVELALT
jgi:hypothetical protein